LHDFPYDCDRAILFSAALVIALGSPHKRESRFHPRQFWLVVRDGLLSFWQSRFDKCRNTPANAFAMTDIVGSAAELYFMKR
jgi:hypothetical protein